MTRRFTWLVLVPLAAACGGKDAPTEVKAPAVPVEARLPRAPGDHAPSFVGFTSPLPNGEVTVGTTLADVDSCATCHPDVAAQWSSSAHSFASFGNPSYRANVEKVRADLGKEPSRHCGGCHDMPLLVDGLMTSDAPIPADDLRSHSGVTCRLCHGITETTHDGNGSYTWNPTPIDAPELGNTASLAKHKAQVATKSLGAELCVGCHKGFLSPDLTLPVHLSGVDEPTMWRNSAFAGNGMGRIDKVENQNCIDCHMDRTPASVNELGAKAGSVASHRFVGGHTWMAAMRGDAEQLRLTRAKLVGAASIDVAGARVVVKGGHDRVTGRARAITPWSVPADGAPVVAGTLLELDVVIRNLLVGHRFPGGLLDVQDTWVEIEVADRHGRRIAASGHAHENNAIDGEAHVLRTIIVDKDGTMLREHEVGAFRGQVVTNTLAPREAQAVRYALEVPVSLRSDQLPLAVTARLRHRSRALSMQEAACDSARTPEGQAFIAGARGARDVTLDPCAPQPITLVAETKIEIGRGARISTTRPAWERAYELGMALVATTVHRIDESRNVLEIAHALAPDARARAMIEAQFGWVAAKHGKPDDAIAWVVAARAHLAATVPAGTPVPNPPVLDAILADAYVRLNKYAEAVEPAKACTERASANSTAWALYARVLVAVGDYTTALTATAKGLDLAPRDPSLLQSQWTSLQALNDPRANEAQAAAVRFRAPEELATLRIKCSKSSADCERNRLPVTAIQLR